MDKENTLTPAETPQKPRMSGFLYGVIFMLASEVCWVLMNAMIKYLGTDFSTPQLLFFRNMVPIPCMLLLLFVTGNLSKLKSSRPLPHLIQGAIGALGMTCIIYALSRLTLSQTVAITYAAPLIITALSGPFLGEKVGIRRWAGVLVGFIGVLVLVKPETGFNPVLLLVLLGTTCFSTVVIIRRRLSKSEDSAVIVLYFSLVVSISAGVVLPWHWQTPLPVQWGLLALMGTLAMGAQYFMVQAIKHAPVSVTAPLLYFSLVFAVAVDVFYWGITPDQTTLTGAGIIILAGLYIVYREIKTGK